MPEDLRPELQREHGIYVEGDLCPACRLMVQERYGGRAEDVEVERIVFSEKHRRGIGTFSRHHGISGSQAWTTALVLMAFAEVISRVVMLQARRLKLAGAATARPVLTAD